MKHNTKQTGRRMRAFSAPLRCLLVVAALLLSGPGMKVAAQTTAPRVTIDAQNAAISKVFETIQSQTGYSVVYNTSDLNPANTIDLHVTDMSLQSTLDRLFKGTDIAYTIKDKHIVLSKKSAAAASASVGGGHFGYRDRREGHAADRRHGGHQRYDQRYGRRHRR